MKKHYLLSACLLWSLFVLPAKAEEQMQRRSLVSIPQSIEQGFTVKGYIKGLDEVEVKLWFRRSNHNGLEKRDEYITTVKNGQFEFSGRRLEHAVYCTIENKENMLSLHFWLDNGQISIEGDIESSATTIIGSKAEDESRLFHATYDGLRDNVRLAYGELKGARERKERPDVIQRLDRAYQRASQLQLEFGEGFVKQHPNSQISLNYLYNCVEEDEGRFAGRLYTYLTPAIQESFGGLKIKRTIDGIAANQVGKRLPEYTVQNSAGQDVRMSDFKGQYLLLTIGSGLNSSYKSSVEFRKKLHLLYHHKGLAQVDLLFNMKDIHEATELADQLGMAWPIWSDYGGLDSEMLRTYHVNSFPTTILVDSDGIIVGRGLGEEEIENILADKLN